jgi:hypothetical protein
MGPQEEFPAVPLHMIQRALEESLSFEDACEQLIAIDARLSNAAAVAGVVWSSSQVHDWQTRAHTHAHTHARTPCSLLGRQGASRALVPAGRVHRR